jgi:hypothetical protein
MNGFDGRYTVHFGHLQIHQNYIWLQSLVEANRLNPVACFADHLNVRLAVQNPFNPSPHHRMIIHEKNANWLHKYPLVQPIEVEPAVEWAGHS